MQRERVRRVWYCTAQRIGIQFRSTDMRWLRIGGAFAVICACHVEQGCIDEAFHLFCGAALHMHGVGDAPRGPRMRATEKRDASVGGVALAEAENSADIQTECGFDLSARRGAKGPKLCQFGRSAPKTLWVDDSHGPAALR